MKVLSSFLIIFVLAGCKETYCPAFPASLIDYFPYIKENTILFKNSQNDTLPLKIVNNWSSDSYSFKWNCKCSCEADFGFDTDLENKYSLKIEGRISVSEETNISVLSCAFYDAQISNDYFSITKEGINPYSNENSSLFGDTIIIEKDNYYRIGMVEIIKGKGVTEFWDNKNNCTWKRIE